MIELSIFNFKNIEFISIEWKIEILLKTKFTYKIKLKFIKFIMSLSYKFQ